MSDEEKTVSARSVGAFLAAVALAIREAEAETHPEPRFLRDRLNLHLEGWLAAESPLSERQKRDISVLRTSLENYLNLASQ